jgi:hypothetical protein
MMTVAAAPGAVQGGAPMLAAQRLEGDGREPAPRPPTPLRGRQPTRLHLPTERADLRVSWHGDDDVFVLSLWHGDVCVGSAPLPPSDAAAVASFLVGRLGERGSGPSTTDRRGVR